MTPIPEIYEDADAYAKPADKVSVGKRAHLCRKCGDIELDPAMFYCQSGVCDICRLPGLHWLAWNSPEEDVAAERIMLRHQDAYGGYKRFAREVFPRLGAWDLSKVRDNL